VAAADRLRRDSRCRFAALRLAAVTLRIDGGGAPITSVATRFDRVTPQDPDLPFRAACFNVGSGLGTIWSP
jgi:hypothetical protein